MKRRAPAAERNREAILQQLKPLLARSGWVLENASGTGQHAVHFASHLPDLTWQPSDVDPAARASITAWREEAALSNLAAPWMLDVQAADWHQHVLDRRVEAPTAVFCANMIHIAPWRACQGLFAGSAHLLDRGSPLVLYGPFRFQGEFTAPSNAAFDASLRASDPSWGVRDVDDLDALAQAHGLRLDATLAMPANNHCLVFRRSA